MAVTAIMIAIFVLGYAGIATEHNLKVNKAGIALITGIVLWVVYIFAADYFVPAFNGADFQHFLRITPQVDALSDHEQYIRFVVDSQVLDHIGDIAETLLFLMGAMTIVELIDVHGGFSFVTNRITTRNKHRLLWTISVLTFFMSALLDNMTTAIVMIMMLRKLIANYKERWLFGSVIVIAANCGGAWSPIGDVTTIMLWVKGNISTLPTIFNLFIPCLVSMLIPVFIANRLLHGILSAPDYKDEIPELQRLMSKTERLSILVLGIACLVSIPVFKAVTHLPPFMGVMLALGILWIYTEIMYNRTQNIDESIKERVSSVLKRIDMSTILFFLGILLSVAALQCAGVLSGFAGFLDEKVHNIYAINVLIGALSSIVDNVPLVAAAIGMYPIADAALVADVADSAYMATFVQDGAFWQLLTYCAGVGGSILIIGSAAGVVVMGLEKIRFGWYMKNISLMALCGYLAGVAVYWLQSLIV
jgi:Na+/H+ antiporter NhaD/arsenite permease-like protein